MSEKGSGERPEIINIGNEIKLRANLATFARYIFATQFLNPSSKVLEVGTGYGHGALLLSLWASSVHGIDYSAEAVKNADELRNHYPNNNLSFEELPVQEMSRISGMYDVVTAFEIIEHLDVTAGEQLIANAKRLLKDTGTLVLSTPWIDFRGKTYWQYHTHEYYNNELQKMLIKYFSKVKVYYQSGDGLNITDKLWSAFWGNPYSSDASLIFVCSQKQVLSSNKSTRNIFYLVLRGIYRNLKYLFKLR